LLLEPQSTNKITNYIPNSNWVIDNGAIITENYAISPDGTQNASRIQLDNSGSNTLTRIYSNFVPDSTNDTASFYAKSNTENSFNITFYLRNTGFGTVRGQKQITVTNEWQRFDLTADCSGASFVDLLIYNTTSNENWDFLMYGIQVEALSYNTSIIPTFGSTATRLGETAINAGDVNVFNSEEGVLYAELSTNFEATGGVKAVSVQYDVNNYVAIYFRNDNNLSARVVGSGNVTQVDATYAINTFYKIAVSYNSTNVKFYVNGTQVDIDTTNTLPTSLNKLSFNRGSTSSLTEMEGKVRNVQVFNKALTDRELEILTIQ